MTMLAMLYRVLGRFLTARVYTLKCSMFGVRGGGGGRICFLPFATLNPDTHRKFLHLHTRRLTHCSTPKHWLQQRLAKRKP